LVSETKTDYQIITPFKVIFRRLHKKAVGLTIVPWLPDELLEEHTIAIEKSQVICNMHPKKEFVDYYHRVSDEYYMTLVDLDTAYRKQLMILEKQERMTVSTHTDSLNDFFNDFAKQRKRTQGWIDEYYDEDEDEEDDDSPTFH
jgi:hypothetical protein